jgi:hypothetical protein
MKESDLYLPIKRFLEAQRYEVKGEIRDCDVFARRGSEEPVIVELKLALNLDLVLQAVDRLAVTPNVYIGVPKRCRTLSARPRQIRKLLRMLGLGLLAVGSGGERASVTVLLDPGEYRPRQSKRRHDRLLGEFEKRVGDPNLGGTKGQIMTVYRQTALQIARYLRDYGPTKAAHVAQSVGAANARAFLYRDVYGWFERPSLGVYALSPRGRREVVLWEEKVGLLAERG